MSGATAIQLPRAETDSRRRNLLGACLAHFLHDGYTDQLYALLPVWQPEFGLSYAGLAVLRALYSATMGGLQMPATRLTARLGAGPVLVLATLIAAAGYALMALPFGFAWLCAGLVISGIGSSLQHPRASLLVTGSYGKVARGPLGIYNFSGDLGKACFPAGVALLLPFIGWRAAVAITAIIGILIAIALPLVLPRRVLGEAGHKPEALGGGGRGFSLLLAIGAFDTATRMGYLLFLPFLVRAKGGHEALIGIALSALFIGGAFGKACCGWLGQRLGVVWSVIITEAATALLISGTLMGSLASMLAVLPVLGIVLNGTSSILYGTVPELSRKGDVGQAFALFYTGVIGAGGFSPILYGVIADRFGSPAGVLASAATALAILPMVCLLGRHMRATPGPD